MGRISDAVRLGAQARVAEDALIAEQKFEHELQLWSKLLDQPRDEILARYQAFPAGWVDFRLVLLEEAVAGK
jgi:hypothetical protein